WSLGLNKYFIILPAECGLRWILQCFQSVHLVFINGIKSSIKLTHRQKLILQFFGASSHQYYFLS
ncbi:hypothetical protein, partial [Dolichospermum sp. UHCC 0684]|uniref:hypothetical protein n=1 Tax=Dolichospermum sp. UHCC 0684 TaxID=3110242 RepID=UPI002B1F681D